MLSLGLSAADSTGKLGFHIFPPANGQDLGTAQRPVSDGKGGFWFLNSGQIWRFDASGYRALGPQDAYPTGTLLKALAEPSTGMWFNVEGRWYHLGGRGLEATPWIPGTGQSGQPEGHFLAIRNEGLARVAEGHLSIYSPGHATPAVFPAPGAGEWIKGWKNPRSEERLLVGDQGLARWDGQRWTLRPLKGLLDGRGWDVMRVRSGALWVRSDRDLVRVEPAPARFGPRLGFTRNSFVTLEEDGFGRIWTNGPEGLACVDGDQVWRISEREGLYGDHSYWPIAFDQQGCLWTISSLGFQRLKGSFLWRVEERAQGLPRAMIFTIHRLPGDGRLYAGSHDGLYRRGPERWEQVPGTGRWALFTVSERKNGEIWTGGNPPEGQYQTLLRIRPGHPAERPVIQGLPPGKWTNGICWEKEDRLWVATEESLFRVEAHGDQFQAVRVELPGSNPEDAPNWIGLGPDGALWVATSRGLFLHGQAGPQGSETWKRFTVADGMAAEDVAQVFAGPRGELWALHDDSKAITRLAWVKGKGWTPAGSFPPGNPLMSNGGTSGWTDPAGHVWIQSASDVVRWDGSRADHYTTAFGLPKASLWPCSLYGEPDGRMYLGSISGLVCYEPRFYQPIPDPPALESGEARDALNHPFLPGASLPFRKAGISFGLMLPLVDGLEDLQCETRLLGLDEVWRPLSGPLLRLPGLAPGHYVLEARAARRDGTSGPVLKFPFSVMQPWYYRPWALLGWLGLLAGLGGLFFRWRNWALLREQSRLEALVAQRTSDLVEANTALVQSMAEVKTLKGLVPICSYCKKIRDDSGFWNQIEAFIQKHSEAKFSHGICPHCEERVRAEIEAEALLQKNGRPDADA